MASSFYQNDIDYELVAHDRNPDSWFVRIFRFSPDSRTCTYILSSKMAKWLNAPPAYRSDNAPVSIKEDLIKYINIYLDQFSETIEFDMYMEAYEEPNP